MPGKVTLRVTKGPIAGQAFAFEEHDTFIFGRAADCHARLAHTDKTASRHHFILEVNPPDVRIRDLGSLNGTLVNHTKYGGRAKSETPEQAAKKKFPEVDLKNGDVIEVGDTVFSVAIKVPALCNPCGRVIPEEEKGASDLGNGSFLCSHCREMATVQSDSVSRTLPPVVCQSCGKSVSEEIGQGRRGDYICQDCQAKASADPAIALLKSLMKEAKAPGPAEIPGYELGEMLGKGGMGAVYLARRKADGATLAIKVMLSKIAVDEGARQAFLREIEVTRSLQHPHCVQLLDHGSLGGAFYFVMENCPGGSVDYLIERRGGKLPLKQAGDIILQALEGLAYAHKQGFVHRDLKPANILLCDKEGVVAKVSDFGLAKNFEKAGFSGMTATGAAAGTYSFMAREQVVNYKYVKPVTDVWSIGASLYYMLTGKTPRNFPRGQDPLEVILRGEIIPLSKRDPSIPARFAQVIDRATADRASDRYQTAIEFRDALAGVI
jgi:serine/threonine-protein kinase